MAVGALKDAGCNSIDVVRMNFSNYGWVAGSIWLVYTITHFPEGGGGGY